MENPCTEKCPDYFKCKKFNFKLGCAEHKEYVNYLNKEQKKNKHKEAS